MNSEFSNLEAHWNAARKTFRVWLENQAANAHFVALHDVDADGLAAGALWQRTLERAGKKARRVVPDRERNAWSESNRQKLAGARPDALFCLDLGIGAQKILPGIPTCFIDHHRPDISEDEAHPGDALISGYSWNPIPNTSWMMWEIGREIAELSDLDWVGVVGTLSDLGEKAPWEQIALCKKKYGAKWLKEATVLVNAPRRSANFAADLGARALLEFENPKALCESESEVVLALREARKEVAAALEEGKKAAPRFAGQVALIRVSSPCQIHPLIAQIWRSRLPKFIVICANDAYLPNRVNFSARSSGNLNALDYLKNIEIAPGEGSFGNGHDQATGGSLPASRWKELLEKMGFHKK
ncbi:DHH family phosphoesterase [Abditibacterium utsteinense]|uniref:DHH family phosphoesterase n=1 Tax=Abditibacterium utsteinense TaxID=1960156 RepID=UPI000F46BB54|nr:DHHA1 domain-containing protein [Abditibacterium utsteinense]